VGLGQDALSCLNSRLEKFASAIKREPVDGVNLYPGGANRRSYRIPIERVSR